MIKYFKELDHRESYFLPLVNIYDGGERCVSSFEVPVSFLEKFHDVFKIATSLISMYKIFDIDGWFRENMYHDYEEACFVSSEYSRIAELLVWYDERIINPNEEMESYLYLLQRLAKLFTLLYPKQKDYYRKICCILERATMELKEMSTIHYIPNRVDNIYQPDTWYITPNEYLYNIGKDSHTSRDLTFSYQNLKRDIIENKPCIQISSGKYFEMARHIEENGYITLHQFKWFLNYASQPVCLDFINKTPIIREKHIVHMVLGIIMARACFYQFFEEYLQFAKNPQLEIVKLSKLTNDLISDILVRCCGFHKVESARDKTITTSCVNYEVMFDEYIKSGWTIQFIPPIIMNKEKGYIEEYPKEFLTIRRILKSF